VLPKKTKREEEEEKDSDLRLTKKQGIVIFV
jgi:hypothetical protein